MINTRVDLRKLVITCLVPVTALLIHNIVYLAGTRICDLTGSQTDSVGSITSCISYILCICIFGYFYLSDHSKTKHAGKKNPFLRAFVIFILLLILGISLQLLTTCILRLIDTYRPELLTSYHERVQRSFSINNGIIRICTVTLLAPIAEEFAFRGVTLKLSLHFTRSMPPSVRSCSQHSVSAVIMEMSFSSATAFRPESFWAVLPYGQAP